VSFIRVELASGAFGSLWFAWQWASLKREATSEYRDKAAAIAEALAVLGLEHPRRTRRQALFVHNGLSAVRPRID